jgi:hypothetical protein
VLLSGNHNDWQVSQQATNKESLGFFSSRRDILGEGIVTVPQQ